MIPAGPGAGAGPDPGSGIGPARSLAAHLMVLADGMDAAARALPSSVSHWKGAAALVAGHLLAAGPGRFTELASAFRSAAGALNRHAEALGPAADLHRQAAQAPVELAGPLRRRSAEMAADSARRTAAELNALAAQAPAAPGRRHRWLEKAGSWGGEIRLGTAEATEGLAAFAGRVALRLGNPLAGARVGDDPRRQLAAVTEAVGHPLELAQAVVDWDTWRTNPARAVGHLTPDLLLALGTGGTAAGVRGAQVASRQQAALAAALERDAATRAVSGAGARAARRNLLEESRTAAGPGGAGWTGEGGTRLGPADNARAEAFHRLSTARAGLVGRAVEQAADAAGGIRRGLETQVKQLDSFKRKVATTLAETRKSLSTILSEVDDTVRHTIELADREYVRGVSVAARRLQDLGFHPQKPHNAWYSGRYRGLNTTWVHPPSGVSFEVQFHTPASWLATVRTHHLYEVFRLRTTSAARKAELSRAIAREFETAPPPGWVQALRGKNWPPAVPDPIVLPPSYTAAATAVGATTAHTLISAERAHDRERGRP